MSVNGVDYAWSHPGGKALAAAGKKFACRYSSNDPSKDISRGEADDLAAHGVWTVVVRETAANRAREGRAAGIADAKAAAQRATDAGMPSGRPLYFAIDYDAPASDQDEINAYFEGVASVIGLARTGAYGGYDQLSRLKTAGLARWWWQTAAWSGGRMLPGRHIYQYARTVTINGVSCDVNEALAADYGQWMPGKTPLTEDDMPLNADDKKWLTEQIRTEVRELLTADAIQAPTADKANPTWSLGTYLRLLYVRAQEVIAKQGAQAGVLGALATAMEKGGGLTAAEVTAAAEAGAQAALDQLGSALVHNAE